jgi:hypothetical protein
MANSFNGHQAVIVTPTATPLATSNVKIRGGEWTGMLAAATLQITDLAGKQFNYVAYQANYPIDIGPIGWLTGLSIPVISSGELKLFLDK